MMLLPPLGKCPMDFYEGVGLYFPNLITIAPVSRDKEICENHMNMK